jgi:acetyl esterase
LLLVLPLLARDSGLPSRKEFGNDYVLTDEQICWAFDQYAPHGPPHDPLIEPFWADDVSGFPPTAVVTVEYDPLRDEGEEFAARIAQTGVSVGTHRVPGTIHPAMLVPKAISASTEIVDSAADLFRSHIARSGAPSNKERHA